MEAAFLIRPEFWEGETTHLLTAPGVTALTPPELPQVAGLIFFQTSGSTGKPKWIGHTRRSLLASAAAVNAHLYVERSSCWGLALPVHHVGGFGVMARTWLAGCRLAVFPGRWNAAVFADWLGREGVTHLSLVPTQVHDLVAAGLPAPASLKAVVVGGGVLPVATGCAARALGWPVLASYGMTETASQIATCKPDLLGEPYDLAPLDLISPWQARTAEGGRLEVSGPSLFSGTLISGDDGWIYEGRRSEAFLTSDLAKVEAGRLTLLGRADSVVKILGELVDPVAVEAELLSLCQAAPGTLAVIAIEDERAGKALVLVHEAAISAVRIATAVAAYHTAAPGFRRISRVVEISAIPRSPLGKVLRGNLHYYM